MSFQWDRPPASAWGNLSREYVDAIRRAIRQLAYRYAPEIEAYMKINAPWTDRTSNARQTLEAEVEEIGLDMIAIILAHGVEYGLWLELSHGGSFSIIGPTLDVFGPRIWNDVQALLS